MVLLTKFERKLDKKIRAIKRYIKKIDRFIKHERKIKT